jgi:hypothetical protein
MSERSVLMTSEQAQILEDVGVDLMRQQDDRAMKVLALSLAYKFAAQIEPPLPSNVVQFDSYSRKVDCV